MLSSARLRRPTGVSGMTRRSRRISLAVSPRGGEGEVHGRSRRSQGLRAAMVMGEGALSRGPRQSPDVGTRAMYTVTCLAADLPPEVEVVHVACVLRRGA